MKNLLLMLALLVSTVGFSQKPPIHEVSGANVKKMRNDWYKTCLDSGWTTEKKKVFFKQVYASDDFQAIDFVLNPGIYNPSGDTGIASIEIIQDNDHIYRDSEFRKVVITDCSKTYSIGQVKDFMIDATQMGFLIRKTFNDGTMKDVYMIMHFDYAILNYWTGGYEALATEPIINSYYEYQDDIDY